MVQPSSHSVHSGCVGHRAKVTINLHIEMLARDNSAIVPDPHTPLWLSHCKCTYSLTYFSFLYRYIFLLFSKFFLTYHIYPFLIFNLFLYVGFILSFLYSCLPAFPLPSPSFPPSFIHIFPRSLFKMKNRSAVSLHKSLCVRVCLSANFSFEAAERLPAPMLYMLKSYALG